ncbi:MAG: Ig-like domain-containing protein [Firmicutes bacterium]|nr:Ig-like domain-containing protein [Bacillota bacterium]MCL2770871.1 Ig-like domain-containing protein [Bacillota bacterium]
MKKKMIALVMLLPVVLYMMAFNLADLVPIETPHISVSAVSLNVERETNIVMDKWGETFDLIATITPRNATEKGVTWVSSNTNVATIDETGRITAVANGTAIVTGTTVDTAFVSSELSRTVVVSSFHFEEYKITVEPGTNLLAGDTATIEVYVKNRVGMMGIPQINSANERIVHAVENSVGVIGFSRVSEETDTFARYEARVEALRPGEVGLTISSTQVSTGTIQSETILFEISQDWAQDIRFEFDGRTYGHTTDEALNPLVVMANTIPLTANRGGISTFEIVEGTAAIIDETTGNLVFSEAGTVVVAFQNAGENGVVSITNTAGQLPVELRPHMNFTKDADEIPYVNFSEIAPNTFETSVSVVLTVPSIFAFDTSSFPADFLEFYNVTWASDKPFEVVVNRISLGSASVTGAIVDNSVLTLTLSPIGVGTTFIYRFNIATDHIGPNEIKFSRQESLVPRGFENVYVFGTMNHFGEAFEYRLNPTIVVPDSIDVTRQIVYTTCQDHLPLNERLAWVDNGIMTFNKDFDFDADYIANSEYPEITVTATALYPNSEGNLATDSHIFQVVNGMNVHNIIELTEAAALPLNIVLQSDIGGFSAGISIKRGLFGNNYLMNVAGVGEVSALIFHQQDIAETFLYSGLNWNEKPDFEEVFVSNVRMQGSSLVANSAANMTALHSAPTLITVYSKTTVRYSDFTGAANAISIKNTWRQNSNSHFQPTHDVHIHQNLIRNSTYGIIFGEGMAVGDSSLGQIPFMKEETTTATGIVVEDLIFERCGVGMFFDGSFRTFNDGTTPIFDKVQVEMRGDMRFYTWMTSSTSGTTQMFNAFKFRIPSFDLTGFDFGPVDFSMHTTGNTETAASTGTQRYGIMPIFSIEELRLTTPVQMRVSSLSSWIHLWSWEGHPVKHLDTKMQWAEGETQTRINTMYRDTAAKNVVRNGGILGLSIDGVAASGVCHRPLAGTNDFISPQQQLDYFNSAAIRGAEHARVLLRGGNL